MSRPVRSRKQVELYGAAVDYDSDESVEAAANAKQSPETKDTEDADLGGFTKAKSRIPKAAKSKKNNAPSNSPSDVASAPAPVPTSRSQLYSAVDSGKGIAVAVRDFLHRYTRLQDAKSRKQAKIDFLNFLIRSAGAMDDVVEKGADIDSLDMDTLLGEVGSVLESQQGYPLLLSPSKDAIPHAGDGAALSENLHFRENFAAFWEAIAQQASGDLLFGEVELADFLLELLLSISSSTFRALRHTATVAGMVFAWQLLRVREQSLSSCETLKSQADAEKRVLEKLKGMRAAKAKTPEKAAYTKAEGEQQEKVEQMESQIMEAEHLASSIADTVDTVFKSLFVHRYRDAAADIRADTLYYFMEWLLSDPATYVANTYLKYVGWMLSDVESARVRSYALTAIFKIFDVLPAEFVAKSVDFIARFRPRIAQMTRDMRLEVSLRAVQVLHKAMLFDQVAVAEVQQVHDCLLDSNIAVRQAASSFLLDQLPAFVHLEDDTSEQSTHGKKSSKAQSAEAVTRRRHKTQLLSLIELIHSLVPADMRNILDQSSSSAAQSDRSKAVMEMMRLTDLVISGFWGHKNAAVLLDWSTFVAIVKDGNTADGGSSSAIDEAAAGELSQTHIFIAVCALMVCFARASGSPLLEEATLGVPSTEDVTVKGDFYTLSQRKEDIARCREASSTEMAPYIPDLLYQFGEDSCIVALLATHMLENMSFGAIGASRGAKHLTDILFHLERLIEMHDSVETLSALASAWAALLVADHIKTREAENKLRSFIDSLHSRCGHALKSVAIPKSGANFTSWVTAANLLRKLRSFTASLPAHFHVSELTLQEGCLDDSSTLFHRVSECVKKTRNVTDIFAAAGTTTATSRRSSASSEAAVVPYALAQECLLFCCSVLLRNFASIAILHKEQVESGSTDAPPSPSDMLPFANWLKDQATLFMSLRHPHSLIADDGDQDLIPLTNESYRLPVELPLAERLYIWRCRYAGFQCLEQVARVLSPAALRTTELSSFSIQLGEEQSHVVTAFVNAALASNPSELVAMGVFIPGVTENIHNKLKSSGRQKTKVADLYDDDDADEQTPEISQIAKSLAILCPLARLSLDEPSIPRLGHLLGRRILEEENDAGVSGVSVVRAHSKKLKERSPDSWLGQQLHSIEESCKVLQKLRVDLETTEQSADLEAINASKERIELVLARVSQLVRRQLQLMGVGKVPKAWWAPLTRVLQLGCEAGLGNVPRNLLMFTFLTYFLQFLPQHCATFVAKTATSCALSSGGATRAEAQSRVDAATKWWNQVQAKAKKSAHHLTFPDEVDGFGAEELRLWAPYVAFRQALTRLHGEGQAKGSQQAANADALLAARVCLNVSITVDNLATASPAPVSSVKRNRAAAKLVPSSASRPKGTIAYYTDDETQPADAEHSPMEESKSSSRAGTGAKPKRRSAAATMFSSSLDDEIASQTQSVTLSPTQPTGRWKSRRIAMYDSEDAIED